MDRKQIIQGVISLLERVIFKFEPKLILFVTSDVILVTGYGWDPHFRNMTQTGGICFLDPNGTISRFVAGSVAYELGDNVVSITSGDHVYNFALNDIYEDPTTYKAEFPFPLMEG